jgi:UDP-N-acetyl-D-mannosaminouronate:lipid I N-acetyl-D-mannosaminouronosyltransferase
MEKVKVNGLFVYSTKDWNELIDFGLTKKKILIAVNAEKILHSNDETKRIINKNIGYPDGFGAVWALKKKGFKETIKIPGCELWLDIIQNCYKEKTFYLIGGREEIINKTVNLLKNEYHGIKILGFRNGFILDNEQKEKLKLDIVRMRPDVVFVAMGSPKQEMLMEELQSVHKALYQGLGGSFDVYTGNVKRAPKWWVRNNLEWAYRLIKQPKRIKRQIHLIKFFFLLQTNQL